MPCLVASGLALLDVHRRELVYGVVLSPPFRKRDENMRLNLQRTLRVEGLETRTLLAADVASIADAYVEPSGQQNRPQDVVIGDVDGNGRFDTSDLVKVFQAGKYETNEPAGWSDGDWNGNQRFESGDLVLAFQSGSYASRPAAAHGVRLNAKAVRLSPGSDGLADAIAAAGPRGTVIVEAGVHTESSSVMITETVTIVGEEGAVIEFDSNAATTSPRLIEAGFHIKDARHVQIEGLGIRDNNVGSTAILIEGSEHVTIKGNRITDFQYGVLVESADHSTFDGNEIGMSTGRLSVTSFGITVANGFGNQIRNNTVSEATFGLFASGENGKLLNNTTTEKLCGYHPV